MAEIDGGGKVGYETIYIPDAAKRKACTPNNMAPGDTSQTELEEDAQSEYNSEQYIVDENVSLSSNTGFSSSRSHSPTRNQFCRICHERNHTERNISPCRCRGTLALVHKSCLEQWLVASDSNKCELCGHKFSVLRKPKYPVLKSLWIWLTDPSTAPDRGNFMKDFVNVALAAPILFVMNHLTYVNTGDDTLTDSEEGTPWYNVLSRKFQMIANARLMPGFYIWCFRKLQHHLSEMYSWYKKQTDVILLDAEPPAEIICTQ